MLCSRCFNGKLKFVLDARLVFSTDGIGRPTGTCEVNLGDSRARLVCPNCGAVSQVVGWSDKGVVIPQDNGILATSLSGRLGGSPREEADDSPGRRLP